MVLVENGRKRNFSLKCLFGGAKKVLLYQWRSPPLPILCIHQWWKSLHSFLLFPIFCSEQWEQPQSEVWDAGWNHWVYLFEATWGLWGRALCFLFHALWLNCPEILDKSSAPSVYPVFCICVRAMQTVRQECGNRGDETFMFVKEWHCKVLLTITSLNTEYTLDILVFYTVQEHSADMFCSIS